MTVTTTTARKDYTGNGSTTDYTFDFKTFSDSDIKVELVLISSGAVTLQVLNTDYTITRTAEGGTVSFTTAPASTYDIVITRTLDDDLQQDSQFIPGAAIYSAGLESILDKLTAAIHDLREEVNRCIKVPSNQDYNTNLTLPTGFNTAGYGVAVNGTADGFETINLSSSGTGLDNVVEDTTPQLGGTLDGQGNTVNDVVLQEHELTRTSVSSSANATVMDLSTARVFITTLTEDTTVSFTNTPASGVHVPLKIYITQDSSARTVTWPGAVIWGGGSAPVLTTVNSKHIISLYTVDGGTTWYGDHTIANAA